MLAGMPPSPSKRNPFVPGSGLVPPRLAGRGREQGALLKSLAHLQSSRGAPGDLVLIGPRGNGKTALLGWFEGECQAAKVDSVWLTPTTVPDLDALATELAPPSRLRKLAPRAAGLRFGGAQAHWDMAGRSGALVRLLAARCGKKPLAVLLDEAHTLDVGVGGALLNAGQEVRRAAPFLLVLAGTPHLQQRLGDMDASFWSRCARLGIGRLTAEASAEAIAAPMAQCGLEIAPDALEYVAADSQHYPYFVQLWGEALWDAAMSAGQVCITREVVAAAQPAVDAVRNDYYADRFAELKAKPLRPLAEAVAAAFQAAATLADHVLDRIADSTVADGEDPQAALEQLRRLGYVWMPPGRHDAVRWEPGIPSLMDYVLRHRAPAPKPGSQGPAP